MRLLANENIPFALVTTLRERGHDVLWIAESAPSIVDQDVLARAVADQRVLLTFERDFGELAFRCGLPASSGIILLRLRASSPDALAGQAAAVIDSRTDWPGHFSVIEPGRIRMTPLPSAS